MPLRNVEGWNTGTEKRQIRLGTALVTTPTDVASMQRADQLFSRCALLQRQGQQMQLDAQHKQRCIWPKIMLHVDLAQQTPMYVTIFCATCILPSRCNMIFDSVKLCMSNMRTMPM